VADTTLTGPPTTEEVLTAYRECRRTKRAAWTTIEFETDLTSNIVTLTRQLADEQWSPGSLMCFAVTEPKPREIWAARFYDRVVHHVIYQRLRPRFEPRFIRTSFACIPGRGTLAGARWAERAVRSATAGWTRTAWALQLDIVSFFTSIDRAILYRQLATRIHEPWLDTAVRRVLFHDVTSDVHFPGNPRLLEQVPAAKSLWNTPPGKGLPIGNLTSQFGANVYMDLLDQHVIRELRPRAYGRYVDDLLAIDTDYRRLAEIRTAITEFAASQLQLTVHRGKTRIINCKAGVDFVGWVIAPHRRSLRRSTVKRANRRITERRADPDELLATVNSYLGMARHGDTNRVRRRWTTASGLTPDDQHTKVTKEP
jgi:hypothetical protein